MCLELQMKTAFMKTKEGALRKNLEFYKGVVDRLARTYDIDISEL